MSSRGLFGKRVETDKIPSNNMFDNSFINYCVDVVLDGDAPLVDQIDWNLRPYVFILK